MTTALGFGARAFLGQERRGGGGRGRQPGRAEPRAVPGRRARAPSGGDIFLAVIAAVAFATILAVVAGPRHLGVRRRGARRVDERDPARADPEDAEQSRSRRRRGSPRSASARSRSWSPSSAARTSTCRSWSASPSRSPRRRTSRRCCSRSRGGASTPPARSPACSPAWSRRSRLVIISPTVWGGVGGDGGRVLVLRPQQPGHHLDPARLPRVLPRHRAVDASAAPSARSTSSTCGRRPGSGAEKASTYEDCASPDHEWEVPERYNIATDVCDKHPRDKLAMVHEHFDGDGPRGALGRAAGPRRRRPPTRCAAAGVERGRPRRGRAAADAGDGGDLLRHLEARRAAAVDVRALRRRRHPPPARRLGREGARHQPRQRRPLRRTTTSW